MSRPPRAKALPLPRHRTPPPEGTADAPPPDDLPTPPPAPKRRVGRMVAIVVAAAVVLGGAAYFAAPAILRAVNPKAYLAACLGRTFADLGDKDVAAVLAALSKGPARLDFALTYHATDPDVDPSLAGLNEAYGLTPGDPLFTYRLALEADRAKRRADLFLEVDLPGRSPLSLRAVADDANVSFGGDALTGGIYYGLNTETLGADLPASPLFGQSNTLPADYGFNLFDRMPTGDAADLMEAPTATLLTQLHKELIREMSVQKCGSYILSNIGKESRGERSALYTVTIPPEALRSFFSQSVRALLEDPLFRQRLALADLPTEEALSTLEESLSPLTACSVDLYVADHRVVSAIASLDTEVDGGPGTLLLELESDGAQGIGLSITGAQGDLAPTGFAFSYTHEGHAFTLGFAPIDGSDRPYALTLSGTLTPDRAAKTLTLELGRISMDTQTAPVNLRYTLAPLKEFSQPLPTQVKPLLELTEGEGTALIIQIATALQASLNGDLGLS